MNILYVVPYVPDLVRVRPYNLIRNLSKRGHNVTVATLWTSAQERQAVESLKKECRAVYAFKLSRARSLANCLAALPASVPLQSVYCWQPQLADSLLGLVASQKDGDRFDIVHIEHLRGARYGLFLQEQWEENGRSSGIPYPAVVWDSVDCISSLFRQTCDQNPRKLSQLPIRFDLKRTKRYESYLLDQFQKVLVTSPVDKHAMLSLYTGAARPDISVLPNGVDLAYFYPDERIGREPATLVVSGKMSYHANVRMVLHLVQNILPPVWGKRPDVKLWVVGKDPPQEIMRLQQNPAITITGTVPDIRPYLQRATVAVCPLVYSAGIQNKVLEAMACGTPVISTPQAVAALSIREGQEVLVAQDPKSFAQAILDVLGNPLMQRRLGNAGRKYAEEHHDWLKIAEDLEGTCLEMVEGMRTQRQSAFGPAGI